MPVSPLSEYASHQQSMSVSTWTCACIEKHTRSTSSQTGQLCSTVTPASLLVKQVRYVRTIDNRPSICARCWACTLSGSVDNMPDASRIVRPTSKAARLLMSNTGSDVIITRQCSVGRVPRTQLTLYGCLCIEGSNLNSKQQDYQAVYAKVTIRIQHMAMTIWNTASNVWQVTTYSAKQWP
jgi:hypothetical protein